MKLEIFLKIAEKIIEKKENGEESLLALVEMKQKNDENEIKRSIFIGIANSLNAKEDFKNILEWLREK